MNMSLLAALGIIALVALIFLGMNVGIAMFVVGIVGYFIATGNFTLALSRLGTVPFTTASSFSYVVIPLFVLMGEFTLESGMAMGLYNAFTDKVDFCHRYGIEITEDQWPCHHLPFALVSEVPQFYAYPISVFGFWFR